MQSDKMVRRRFDELAQKAEAIWEAKTFYFQGDSGRHYYHIDPPAVRQWLTSVLNLIQRVFGESSVHYRNLAEEYKSFRESSSDFEDCRAIFLAAKEDYEGGYLFTVRGIIKAEVLADSLEQAGALLDAGYKDPACVAVGVALESALKEASSREGISFGKADRMNVELCKAGVYNLAKQKQITAWLDLRNRAAHGEWSAYSESDVRDFLQGVTRFIGDFL